MDQHRSGKCGESRQRSARIRVEILKGISGVEFAACYARRRKVELDEVSVNLILLDDLKRNKEASGRLKDRLDLERLS